MDNKLKENQVVIYRIPLKFECLQTTFEGDLGHMFMNYKCYNCGWIYSVKWESTASYVFDLLQVLKFHQKNCTSKSIKTIKKDYVKFSPSIEEDHY